jgi:2-keto-4-pentenoate hydratase/2-oxohepta-3-ene-1,7-dioic acid hydratase in catechol pathway
MRLLSFCHRGRSSIGIEMDAERILDLNLADRSLPTDMRTLLELGEEAIEQVRRLLKNPTKGAILSRSQLHVGPPIRTDERPKVFCIGLNYADHAAESGSKVPEDPLVFAKFPTALCGPQDSIVCPPGSTSLDYEVELVVVIGKRAKRVSQAEAYDYVAGYTCGNDVSERNFQRKDSQWLRAKSSDTFAPLGPVIVTKEEIPDPHVLGLGCKVNNEVRQNSSTRQLIFKVPRLVEFISDYITLEPGDLIFTGTPPGVGFAMKPPRWLTSGDQVEVWVEGIGSLLNRVVETPW